jgi:cytochrome c556
MLRFVLIGAAALTFCAAQASAQALSPDQIIAVRQAFMDLQGGNAAAMKAAVEAKEDVKPLAASAKALVSSSRMIPTLFPAGTEKGHDTKAKPEVWSDRAGFEKAAANLGAQAEKLAAAADANDKAAFATQFAAVGQACGGCHRPYRAQ